MKSIILLFFLRCSPEIFCQPTPEMKRIDSMVYRINASDLHFTRDTIIQDREDLGLYMRTIRSVAILNNHLIVYVNYVLTQRMESGRLILTTTSNNFFFDQDRLIKGEDIAIEKGGDQKEYQEKGSRVLHLKWYFSGDRHFYPNRSQIKTKPGQHNYCRWENCCCNSS